jgi:hypothetical protein
MQRPIPLRSSEQPVAMDRRKLLVTTAAITLTKMAPASDQPARAAESAEVVTVAKTPAQEVLPSWNVCAVTARRV